MQMTPYLQTSMTVAPEEKVKGFIETCFLPSAMMETARRQKLEDTDALVTNISQGK